MEVHSVRAELFYTDGRTDRQTDGQIEIRSRFCPKQTKICHSTQQFNFMSHNATCFVSQDPSSGTSSYKLKKK